MAEKPLILRAMSDVLHEYPDFKPKWLLSNGEPFDRIVDPEYGQLEHVVVCEPDGTPLYDQPNRIEPLGAIMVVVNSLGNIGLIESYRANALIESRSVVFPHEFNPEEHGKVFLEVPRGFPLSGEMPDETAVREAAREIGSVVTGISRLGEVNLNNAIDAQSQQIYLVTIDESQKSDIPDDSHEKILSVKYYDPSDVWEMVYLKDITCGATLNALMLYFAHESLK